MDISSGLHDVHIATPPLPSVTPLSPSASSSAHNQRGSSARHSQSAGLRRRAFSDKMAERYILWRQSETRRNFSVVCHCWSNLYSYCRLVMIRWVQPLADRSHGFVTSICAMVTPALWKAKVLNKEVLHNPKYFWLEELAMQKHSAAVPAWQDLWYFNE